MSKAQGNILHKKFALFIKWSVEDTIGFGNLHHFEDNSLDFWMVTGSVLWETCICMVQKVILKETFMVSWNCPE
jgi:hypothetical protein